MNILVHKGEDLAGSYTLEFSGAVDWAGTADLYSTYPGGAVIASSQLTFTGTALTFSFSASEVLNIANGIYTLVASITSTTLSASLSSISYVTIAAMLGSNAALTTLTMTILKADGTPAGRETRTVQNTVDGSIILLTYEGVKVTAFLQTADALSGNIVGIELVTTTTNAAGYAELQVLKGLSVVVSCPSFGKTVTVDTTGLDTIDLSSYF
jgi:hypothetical protein